MTPETVSNIDAAILNVEDPTSPDTMGVLFLFDGQVDEEELVARVEEHWLKYPRFRQRIRARAFGRLQWVDDPTFDIRSHIRRLAVPEPHDTRALRQTVSELMAMLLDRSKPLWSMHIIEGGPGGDALLIRMHHAIGDGVTLFATCMALVKERYAPALKEKRRGFLGRVFEPLVEAVEVTQSVSHWMREHAEGGLPSAEEIIEGAGQAVGLGIKLFPMIQDPKTSLTGPLTRRKQVAWTPPVSARDYRRASRALGVTSNDFALALIAGALRRHFRALGEPVPRLLHASVPVYLRDTIEVGNNFGLVLAPLPIGEADPHKRVRLVHEAMEQLKKSPEAQIISTLFNAAGNLPPGVVSRIFDEASRKASVVVTNVPGPPRALTLAGAPLKRVIPIVPLSGHIGVGIAIVTYDGHFTLGIQADRDRLQPDIETFIQHLRAELALLTSLAEEAGGKVAASRQCAALTLAGKRCRNRVRQNERTCYVHRALEVDEPTEAPPRSRRSRRRGGTRRAPPSGSTKSE